MFVCCCSITSSRIITDRTRLSRLLEYLLYLLTLHSYLLSHVTRLSDRQNGEADSAVTAAVKDKRETENDVRVTVTLHCRLTVTVTETDMAPYI